MKLFSVVLKGQKYARRCIEEINRRLTTGESQVYVGENCIDDLVVLCDFYHSIEDAKAAAKQMAEIYDCDVSDIAICEEQTCEI